MKTKAGHTPTPWKVTKRGTDKLVIIGQFCSSLSKKGGFIGHEIAELYGGPENEIDAAFIVQAVNANEKLVAAAKKVIAFLESNNLLKDLDELGNVVQDGAYLWGTKELIDAIAEAEKEPKP